MRKLKRTLSYLLILIMLLQLLLIPMSVSGEKPAEPGIVRELCELRGTNTETYLRTVACMNASSFPKIRIFQRNTRAQAITRTTTSVQVVMTPMKQDAFL